MAQHCQKDSLAETAEQRKRIPIHFPIIMELYKTICQRQIIWEEVAEVAEQSNTSCSTDSESIKRVIDRDKRFIGTLCRINYLLIMLALIGILCSLIVPLTKANRAELIAFSIIILVFEGIARPFSYYAVSSKGLSEYRFGKKKRLIEWREVTQVGKQLDALGHGAICGVIVTLRGAPNYTRNTKLSSFRYFLAHRPNVLYVYDYEQSISVIESYYGPPDYTSKDDLLW